MIGNGQMRAAVLLLGSATLLMALGLGVELGLTRPRLNEIRRLEERQKELLQQAAQKTARRQQIRDMASTLQVAELAELQSLADTDPVVYLGRVIRQAKLNRRELSVRDSKQDATLQRNSFVVRVDGDFARMLNFIRILEQSPRPVTVDALDIKVPLEGTSLEGKFEVTVYDPVQVQEAKP